MGVISIFEVAVFCLGFFLKPFLCLFLAFSLLLFFTTSLHEQILCDMFNQVKTNLLQEGYGL